MVIFLHGVDTFRSRRFLQGLKDKFTREVDPNSGSLSVLDGRTVALKDLTEKINTGSLFVKKRMVIIENIFKNKSDKIFTELSDYLKKFSGSEDNIIIFREEETSTKDKPLKVSAKKLFNFLSQQPYSQEFSILTGSQLLSFIKKEINSYNREIGPTAASLLINLTDGDLWLLAGAIKKLSFHTDQKIITTEDVKEMVAGSYDENIFGLTDALSAKNKKLAITLLEEQYAAGLSDEYLITMLTRQFKILLQIREAIDRKMNISEIPSYLKLHPYIVKKGSLQAKNFTVLTLKNYLNQLIDLDFLNKTSPINIKTELTLFISGL